MSARVEELRASRAGYSVQWMRFLKLATSQNEGVLCVFEGEDAKYFGWRIDAIGAVEWQPTSVGGRDNVLAIMRLSRDTGQHYERSYFFIDRDYDEDQEVPSDPRLYVTPTYSIENLYCTDSALERILRDEFGCPSGGVNDDALVVSAQSHQRIRDAFSESRSSFLAGVSELNAWAVCHRRRESTCSGGGRLMLNEIKVLDFCRISIDRCEVAYDLNELHAKHSQATFPSDEEMGKAREYLAKRGLLNACRGKFVASFMRTYITRLRDDSHEKSPGFVVNGAKAKINVSEKNFLSDLSQYADTPPCLKSFLMGMTGISTA